LFVKAKNAKKTSRTEKRDHQRHIRTLKNDFKTKKIYYNGVVTLNMFFTVCALSSHDLSNMLVPISPSKLDQTKSWPTPYHILHLDPTAAAAAQPGFPLFTYRAYIGFGCLVERFSARLCFKLSVLFLCFCTNA
jgi:hypothetical protein